jgi:N-methylhydantoinase A
LNNGTPAVLKLLSTPADPAKSVLEAIRAITARVASALQSRAGGPLKSECLEVRHGTTIGTNALLERKGARVAFVTTSGFEDTISIGRQARQDLYNWMATPRPCLVPPELRFGVKERVSAEGEILISPGAQDLAEVSAKVRLSGAESIAISLLFSFANPENEKQVAAALRQVSENGVRRTQAQPNLPISISHEILPEFREYERAATVVVNAYLAPKAGGYVHRLESAIQNEHGGSLYVMQSSGGIISGTLATSEPVRTVLSGPAGGVIGAHRIAQLAGFENIIGFDMGGTSTDVSLIDSSGPRTTSEARVSEIPISVPMLDIHTVGAGGGSLAWFDRGGILHVGPASAGADPGPICYGRGEQPTVTDANLVLGRLDPDLTLAGTVQLDEQRTRRFIDRARGTISSLNEFAAGIIRVAEAEMEKAIRLISVEQGHDPREFTLVCFGGAGPLHACSLAQALGIPRVLVPAMPGALSALGILMSDVVRDYSQTVMIELTAQGRVPAEVSFAPFARPSGPLPLNTSDHKASTKIADKLSGLDQMRFFLEPHFAELETKAAAEFHREGLTGVAARSVDLRYAGQGYELNIPFSATTLNDFHAAHRKRYGHADETRSVEAVNVRLRMTARSEQVKFQRSPRGPSKCDQAITKRKEVWFEGEWIDTPFLQRDLLVPGNEFAGPAIVHEYSTTAVVPPRCTVGVDEYSNLVIEL